MDTVVEDIMTCTGVETPAVKQVVRFEQEERIQGGRVKVNTKKCR